MGLIIFQTLFWYHVDAVLALHKCTKHQFIHLLMAILKNLHIENSKNHKRWYCPHHTDCVNMLLNNIILWFLLFSMCEFFNIAVNWCFVHLYLQFYFWNTVFLQLERYCASDIFYSSQTSYNCYLLPDGVTEQSRRHASAWRHHWPALLTILKKIHFISTKWP